ncbi:MAG: CocE/NonD family hydrolase [Proteobacteria bacterium]|nr:CocE/NonD family hydrolase [Pseudomonadota bacterium]
MSRAPSQAIPRCLLIMLLLARVAIAADDGITIEEAWIEMPDGVLLAADLYKPAGLEPGDKLPVLLEYTAYRKTDSRSRNYSLFSYFIEQDYIVARVDIRGTGNSEGRLIPYEYSDIELDDGEVIIDWLSKQAFSNGNVGVFGISWGGFNAIQLAVRQPPALKAIIAVDATEDLYQDDVHFMDGIMHMDSWEMTQDLDNARPGAPDYVIDDDNFRNRFDTEPWMLTYKKQQRDGPFWDRASARDKYDQIKIPAFHIGGWYDGYRDSLPRMLANVEAPVKAMIGAWSHAWPHNPYPKPGMEWRNEAVRWFDQFLKGEDTGILDEPRFAVYVREWHPPGPYLDYAPGSWRWEEGWPIARIQPTRMYPQANHTLSIAEADETVHSLRYVPSSGLEAGGPVMWWGDVAHDQRPTDAFSLVYDTEPLAADTEILGLPLARLNVSADAPRANWMVRLSDVAPDGTVTQVAGAAFNGTHRNSAREPEDIVPGEAFDLEIEMHFTSWVFPKGHRIRFAVSNAQWPMLWPTPYPMTTTLRLGGANGSFVELPIAPPGHLESPAFLPPKPGPKYPGYESIDVGTSSGYGEISSVDRNPQTGEVTATATNSGATKYPWGTETYQETIVHKTSDAHPENTSMTGTHRLEVKLEGRTLLWEGNLSFSSDRENFYYQYSRRISENGELVREKSWQETIPRDYQ